MKGIQKWMGLGLATMVGFSALAPVGEQVSLVHATTTTLPFNAEVVKGYATTEPLIAKAEQTQKESDVIIAYESFIKMSQLFILDDQNVYKEGNDMDKLYERLNRLMYGLPDNLQNKLLPVMADKWVVELKNNKSSIMSFYLKDLLLENPKAEIKKDFDLSYRKLVFYQSMPPGTELPANFGADIEDLIDEQEASYSKPVLDNPNSQPNAKTEVPDKDGTSSTPRNEKSVEFIQDGKFWYEVTSSYKNGKIVKTDKRKLSVSEAPHLYQEETTTDTGTNTGNPVLFPELTDRELAYLLEDQNEESKHSIQYSLDKQGEAPYYFDTGLRVDSKMNASYEQYKDVLYQIAVKSGGYVVEDEGRVLVVIDKKAIIVKDIKKSYKEAEIESLFESFPNIDIRILETRIGTSTSLEQQIVSKQARTVSIEGNKVDLETTPIIREERVLLPIKEIASKMGATLEQNGAQFIVQKDGVTVVYELKNKKIVVKGKQIDIGIAPDVKEGVLYVEMSELASAFNYEMVWDGDSSELAFNKK